MVIALVVTPDGFPLGYEVMNGNTRDSSTLKGFLEKIEQAYGPADRIWVMDRGIPTEEILEQMRESDPKVFYLVGTPKGRLTKLEKNFLEKPWREVSDNLEVKLLEREGRYLLRSNLFNGDPAQMWKLYTQLTEIEEAFKTLKGDLCFRPIHRQKLECIEAHLFIAFLAYCLHVTLKRRLRDLAPGLTPRSLLEKIATLSMIDVHLPTTDGRTVVLTRYNPTV